MGEALLRKTRPDGLTPRGAGPTGYGLYRQIRALRQNRTVIAGAGGVRSRGISDRMSWNICRDMLVWTAPDGIKPPE